MLYLWMLKNATQSFRWNEIKRTDKDAALSNLSKYNTWKIKNLYKYIKFKISGLTWNEKFELSDVSCSVSDIQDFFLSITSKNMKLIGSTKIKITKDENGENIPHLEITEVVIVHFNISNNDY